MSEDERIRRDSIALWLLCKTNPSEGFSQMFRDHTSAIIYCLIRRHHLDPASAEDLAHDTYVKVMEEINTPSMPEEVENVRAFLLTVATNIFRNKERKKQTASKYKNYISTTRDSYYQPSTDAMNRLQRVVSKIEQLKNEEYKTVLTLTLSGMAVKDIAKQLDKEPEVVSRLKYNAKEALKRLL